MILREFKYQRPQNIEEAKGLIEKSADPLLLAGGTIIFPLLKRAQAYPKEIIGIKNISSLKAVRRDRHALSIGAMATLDDLMRNKEVLDNFKILSEVISCIATPQIRNMATIGGNVCSGLPWVDLPVVLLALDAALIFNEKNIEIGEYLSFPKKYLRRTMLKEIIIPLKKIEKYGFSRMTNSNATDIPLTSVCIIKFEKGMSVSVNLGNNHARRFVKTEEELLRLEENRDKDSVIDIFKQELEGVQKDEYRGEMTLACFKDALKRYE